MKKFLTLLLTLCLIFTTWSMAFAENPTTLEAPQNLSVRYDSDILLRYTIPQSIIDALDAEEWEGDVLFCVDWKVNNNPWHYDTPVVNADTYDRENSEEAIFNSYLTNIFWDEDHVQELFFTHWDFGLSDDIDLTNNKYTFRVRYAFRDDSKDENQDYITSPWSKEVSIGGSAQSETLKSIDAPTGLKVDVKFKEDDRPYFYLTWNNPDSVGVVNQSFPIKIKVDMKVGNGAWHSETFNHDWWGSEPYETFTEFDPVEKGLAEGIAIEENTYYFRILYAYESEDHPNVYSGFSNTVSAGVQAFYSNASPWAESHLENARKLGIVTDRMMGADMTAPITREEFAEIAVKFYEVVTGKTATAGDKSFLDSKNPEVLKAANLNITAGVGDGTKFEPNSFLQRQQMATMIVKTLQACYSNIVIDISGQPDFKDQSSMAAYAVERAKFMAKYKITAGDGQGNFVPEANCTRQEAITFLVKAYDVRDTYIYSD